MSFTAITVAHDVSRCHQVNYYGMARWKSNARGRLEQAALDLYSDRGFEQTTVAEIAARAGLTERTFFRHFADKREVLFGGSSVLQDLLVEKVSKAPASLAPLDAVAVALGAAETLFPERREASRQRQRIIAANAELRERELIKLASLSAALAEVLRNRGTEDPAATLAAEAGITVFKLAFERWADISNPQAFAQLVQDTLSELRAVTAGE